MSDVTKETVARDEEGYLVNPDEWNESIAETLASEEQLTLNDEHWVILHAMRAYYDSHKIVPDIRHIAKDLAATQGYDKKEARNRIFALFPYGYVKQACKISGMKRPRGWSTG